MVEKLRDCGELLLLVGSNPLPNFLTALILKPKLVRLFYSEETKKVKDRLKKKLKEKLPDSSLDEKFIEDAANAEKVRKAINKSISIPPGTYLNYTGGTKIMAAHARMAFGARGGTERQASYLDERRGVLRFDDGDEIDLSRDRLELTLNDILALHGIETIPDKDPPQPAPTMEDTQIIARA
ncbi:MAG TPA: hypothetical protein PK360_00880, partial [bacterium]|nr:hypothetical protein [bacterium]